MKLALAYVILIGFFVGLLTVFVVAMPIASAVFPIAAAMIWAINVVGEHEASRREK